MRKLLVLLILCGLLVAGGTAQAQARPPELIVVHTALNPQPQATSLPVSIFFSLRDQNGDAVIKTDVTMPQTATLTLVDPAGNALPQTEARISTPDTPIRIALVIDKSGSMNKKVNQPNSEPTTLDVAVRKAAIESLQFAPDQAEFAVYSFAQQVQLESGGFIRKRDQAPLIEQAIRQFQVNPSDTGNTCLSDAANKAIDDLVAQSQSPTERKAIILFTDGKDKEGDNNPKNGNNCNNIDLKAIAEKAKLRAGTVIPIYTIAPCIDACDNIRRGDLEDLSRTTRAAAAIDTPDKINDLFKRIMLQLDNQWVAQANLFTRQGQNTATLTINSTVKGIANRVAGATTIESDRDYFAPAKIEVKQMTEPAAGKDSFTVALAITNPKQVSKITAEVYDRQDGGTLVSKAQEFEAPGDTLTFDLPTDGFAAGNEYYLRIKAFDANKNPILDERGNKVLPYAFKYNPKLDYSIVSIDPQFEAGVLNVKVDTTGIGGRNLLFKGTVTNKATGETEPLSETPLQRDTLPFTMPPKLRAIKDAQTYDVQLSLQAGEELINRNKQQQITPPVVVAPAIPPVVWIVLAALLLIFAGFLIFTIRKARQPREIPRPFNSPTMLRPPPAPVPAVPAPTAPPVAAKAAPAKPAVAVRPPAPAAPAANNERTVLHAVSAEATVLHGATEIAAVPRQPRVRVAVVTTPDQSQMREETIGLPCVIGREHCQIAITGDAKISRTHAEIKLVDGVFMLIDRNSTNGTFVGDQQIPPGGSVVLEAATIVRLGPNTTLEIEPKP